MIKPPPPYGTPEFWTRYRRFVAESLERHRRAISTLPGGLKNLAGRVLDLGCGQATEGWVLTAQQLSQYLGVDQQLAPGVTPGGCYRRGNYRHGAFLRTLQGHNPQTVISLFSVEPTGTVGQNRSLYRQVFKTFPTVDRILSAGFYYQRHWDQEEPVLEAGGLASYQVNGAVPMLEGELRVSMPAPSRLFGSDVVEVWRYLPRL